MFKTIQQLSAFAVMGGIVDMLAERTETIKLNTVTGKFFVRFEHKGYEERWISDATVYNTVRKFDTLADVLAYLGGLVGDKWVRA